MTGQSWGSMEKVTRQPLPGITRKAWHALLDDMIELEAAGALGGIRAVVAERLGQVRTGAPGPGLRGRVNAAVLREVPAVDETRSYAITAAVLAAEIDRQSGAL
jgi:hypothetical protein